MDGRQPGRLIFHLSFCYYAPGPTISASWFDVQDLPGCGAEDWDTVSFEEECGLVGSQIGSGVVPNRVLCGSEVVLAQMVSALPTTYFWNNILW